MADPGVRLRLICCLQVYETFGPTLQPFYQIRFGEKYPLDAEKVQVSRPVFHVPRRSRFVNVAELRKLKGSDASNVHDEEVAEYELEFSDDEAGLTSGGDLLSPPPEVNQPGNTEENVAPSPLTSLDSDG